MMKRRIHFTILLVITLVGALHPILLILETYNKVMIWNQPNDFIDWLTTVERIFDFKDILGNHKVKIVAIKLRKHASI